MTDLLWKALWRAVLLTALIASIPNLLPNRGVDPEAVRQQSGNTVFFDHRDTCWMEGPAHVDMPTHVVMRVEDGTRGGHWFYGGKRYVDIALNDAFTHDNPRVYVYAFCE